MRKHLYRGKRVDNGEWVEWDLINDIANYDHPVIGRILNIGSDFIWYEYTEVIPETVGEFIGIRDCRNRRLFEGDFVYFKGHSEMTLVAYDVESLRYKFCNVGADGKIDLTNYYRYSHSASIFEKHGNIHDNPELLEESR